MNKRKLAVFLCGGLMLGVLSVGCAQHEGKIIPPAPNTLPEGAKLTVGVAGAPPAKKQSTTPRATTPTNPAKSGEGKKDEGKKDDKPGDDKKPAPDASKDNPKL
jgi:hypothetical protein